MSLRRHVTDGPGDWLSLPTIVLPTHLVLTMPVNLPRLDAQALHAVPGLQIGTAKAGVRKAGRTDLVLMALDAGCEAAAVFTQNRFCAAPVQVCQQHLAGGTPVRALVINTGNANAGTGADGLARARRTCAAVAELMKVSPESVLPFSTGVIMETLPVDRIEAALPAALADLQAAHWGQAAEGIMTTDTVPKAASRQITLGGKTVTVTGISKGAGMIRPNMATMLGFVATDAVIGASLLTTLVKQAADASFNRITIDGDTSTNDSFVLVATQCAGHAPITDLASADGQALATAVIEVSRQLAQAIVRDGEGARRGRMPTGRLRHCPLAPGQDRLLCQRPQPGPHPGGGGLCGYRRSRSGPDRSVPG
jgi:glutamate N-acetyltransferase / amino-acid N-acetyltransferase